jgi:DNA-directed RNA polymerase subunit RPC12/RpoP
MERSQMSLFNRNRQEPRPGRPSPADYLALAEQKKSQAMEQAARLMSVDARALQQATSFQRTSAAATAATGSPTWARQVLAILAPPPPGFVKRCSCMVCGAPKKLPSVTAYVYCDYCAALIDYDLRRACEGDTRPGPAYAATVNATQAAARTAAAAGDRDTYRDLQRKVYEAYAANVPMAVSHRAKNDPGYRAAYVNYMAEFALARAFDPAAQTLGAEMKQRVMDIRYAGVMMSPKVSADSFWPVVDTLHKEIENSRALYRSAGLAELDPDHAEQLVGKMAWAGFCQGWLGMLPAEAAERLLDRADLKNEYVPIQPEDGQPRHCGGCGGEFSALPGATAVICDGCGRKMDLGSAEVPCSYCGATITLPAGADGVACPFCQSRVERAGIR